MLEDIEFVTDYMNTYYHDNSRLRKFTILLDKAKLPYDVRTTLLDLFPKIENYFYYSNRDNFINLNQLASELCSITGYPEHATKFKTLKTKSREKTIKTFINEALGGGPFVIHRKYADVVDLQTFDVDDPDLTRVYKSEHLFCDLV